MMMLRMDRVLRMDGVLRVDGLLRMDRVLRMNGLLRMNRLLLMLFLKSFSLDDCSIMYGQIFPEIVSSELTTEFVVFKSFGKNIFCIVWFSFHGRDDSMLNKRLNLMISKNSESFSDRKGLFAFFFNLSKGLKCSFHEMNFLSFSGFMMFKMFNHLVESMSMMHKRCLHLS